MTKISYLHLRLFVKTGSISDVILCDTQGNKIFALARVILCVSL